jgi:hypothetical protein
MFDEGMPNLTKQEREEAALSEVEASRKEMTVSKDRWTRAVLEARKIGISNVRIASRSDVTETAIRLLVNRAESTKLR